MTVSTPITTPFTAESTAAEVVDGIDLTGRRAIVTGGASGIGIETARALAGAGAEVTLAVRNLAAGERITRDIITTSRNEHVLAAPLDLADQASVASFTNNRHWLTTVAGQGRGPQTEPGRGGPRKTRRSPQTPRSGKLSRSAQSLVRVIAGER